MSVFRVWAPVAEREVTLVVAVECEGGTPEDLVLEMRPEDGGWWSADVPAAQDGAAYAFRIDGDTTELPDPRSAWQPDGVHGRSRVVDRQSFAWTDDTWRGRLLAGSALYECHIGTFTPEGTFDAAIAKLPYLVELGVDAVELLPVAAVPGRWNWGYDGVGLWAVTEAYGGPAGLVRFVDAAHGHGLAVVLDVVYNHLGPSGNYLGNFGPYFGSGSNSWGTSINLDGPESDEVRSFVIDNALMWLRDYHLDGLRLDAVHALPDQRALHLLEELAVRVDALAHAVNRPLWLIAESDLNDPMLIRSREAGGYGLDAQWTDDVHHALHATLTGERQGYYGDFGSLPVLAKALTRAFVHDGGWSSFRKRSHGRPTGELPGSRFVVFLQDHDQIGNRATGDRISATVSPATQRVGAALLLCSPFTPMLFMGEEWGASTPWMFFSDMDDDELRRATSEGRRAEFADHGWAPGEVPDPSDPQTFHGSVLSWAEAEAEPHAGTLAWYRKLLALRRSEPDLRDGRRERTGADYDEQNRWFVLRRGDVLVVANLGTGRVDVPVEGVPVEVLAASTPGFSYTAGTVTLDGESVVIVRRLPT